MTLINDRLQKIRTEKRIGLMTHVIVGYPSLEKTENLVKVMAEEGVDFIELQIPFSDPLADGPTIMKACDIVLRQGTTVNDAFSLMTKMTADVSTPLLFMGYYNTVFKYGVERFCHDAKKAGAAGLIIPDMPLEEERNEHFTSLAEKYGLPVIRVVSPASTEERLQKNARAAKGFVYCSARQGTTGTHSELSSQLSSYLKKVKEEIPFPLAVGFGISRPEHIQFLQGRADIAVIGSALINLVDTTAEKNMEKEVRSYIRSLRMV